MFVRGFFLVLNITKALTDHGQGIWYDKLHLLKFSEIRPKNTTQLTNYNT